MRRIRPAPTLRGWAPALLLVAALALPACRPLYVPLVPEAPQGPLPTRLAGGSALTLSAAGRPRLAVEVLDLPGPGWLAVQWFAPGGGEAASESVWLEPPSGEAEFVLPPDVEATAGEWRAVVSFEGLLLRQFLLVVPSRGG